MREAEYIVRSADGDSEPFDSYDEARTFANAVDGRVLGRMKK